MEPISFTLAIAGIPSIFKSCVDCYQYVQFGRAFAPTFSLALSQLEASEMRLTRWGAAMSIENSTALQEYNEEDIKTAYRWLQQIESTFGAAIETSSRCKGILKEDQLQILETETELENMTTSFRSFHLSLRRINEARFRPRKRGRISWALYKKTTFEELVSTISILVNNLVELFPNKRNTLQELCRHEVKEIDTDHLPTLKTISANDEILLPILNTELKQRAHKYDGVNIDGSSTAQFGDNYANGDAKNHSYTNVLARGDSFGHFGNNVGNYQGRTIFDSASIVARAATRKGELD